MGALHASPNINSIPPPPHQILKTPHPMGASSPMLWTPVGNPVEHASDFEPGTPSIGNSAL